MNVRRRLRSMSCLAPICINSQNNYALDAKMHRGLSSAQASVDTCASIAGQQEDAPMASRQPARRLLKQQGSTWPTASVLLIGLLSAVPGARADTIPDWNLIT